MYSNVGWGKFLLGLAVVAVPAILLERGDERLAWRYVGLILLLLVLWNANGLGSFAAYLVRELQGAAL